VLVGFYSFSTTFSLRRIDRAAIPAVTPFGEMNECDRQFPVVCLRRSVDGVGLVAGRMVAFITIVGIPWGKACFVIGQFAPFFPFGKEAIDRKTLSHRRWTLAPETLGLIGNIIWFIFAGIWRPSGT